MQNTRLPDHFYKIMISWLPKFPSIKNKHLLFCIAIEHFNNEIKSMSEKQLESLDKELLKLCKNWVAEGKISKHARGIGDI